MRLVVFLRLLVDLLKATNARIPLSTRSRSLLTFALTTAVASYKFQVEGKQLNDLNS